MSTMRRRVACSSGSATEKLDVPDVVTVIAMRRCPCGAMSCRYGRQLGCSLPLVGEGGKGVRHSLSSEMAGCRTATGSVLMQTTEHWRTRLRIPPPQRGREIEGVAASSALSW